ncbi:hypothetical protein [Actinophytocola sp.]|uniref:hypothetical protein n=1 Tax=Actinophytocola sp. TaxID=1872138 RepID=UPI002ED18A4C
MRKVAVDCSLAHWQRLLLALSVLVAAWAPAHSAEIAAVDHNVDQTVERVAQTSTAGSHAVHPHDSAATVPDGLESLGGVRDRGPGGRDDQRCGHRDTERDATQATAVRLPQPDVVSGQPVTSRGDAEPRPVVADLDVWGAPPGQTLVVMVCVWRQ